MPRPRRPRRDCGWASIALGALHGPTELLPISSSAPHRARAVAARLGVRPARAGAAQGVRGRRARRHRRRAADRPARRGRRGGDRARPAPGRAARRLVPAGGHRRLPARAPDRAAARRAAARSPSGCCSAPPRWPRADAVGSVRAHARGRGRHRRAGAGRRAGLRPGPRRLAQRRDADRRAAARASPGADANALSRHVALPIIAGATVLKGVRLARRGLPAASGRGVRRRDRSPRSPPRSPPSGSCATIGRCGPTRCTGPAWPCRALAADARRRRPGRPSRAGELLRTSGWRARSLRSVSNEAYAAAGVDIGASDRGVDALVGVLKTIELGRPSASVLSSGHYAAVLRVTDELGIALSTDGVGSKLVVAERTGRLSTVGIDCVAMNVNDIVCVGAEPIALLDYLAVEQPDPEALAAIAEGLKVGAEAAGVEIPGGELAVIPELIRGPSVAARLRPLRVVLRHRRAGRDRHRREDRPRRRAGRHPLQRPALQRLHAGPPACSSRWATTPRPEELGGATVADVLLEPTRDLRARGAGPAAVRHRGPRPRPHHRRRADQPPAAQRRRRLHDRRSRCRSCRSSS